MPATDNPEQIYVKSFFASSIAAAIEQARTELGPDALLLSTREAPPEARHLGRYEAVFGSAPERGVPAASAPAAPAGVDELRRGLEELRSMVTRLASPASASGYARPQIPLVERMLVDAGVPADMARDIDEVIRQRLSKRAVLEIARVRNSAEHDEETLLREVLQEICNRFEVSPKIGSTVAFVGPPGAGKTTTLVKLAITHGLSAGRPVRLISADTQRVGGAEQLRSYAAILGAPFQAVEGTAALAQAVDSAPSKALVLIDTPGYSPAMLQELGRDLAAFLSRRQDIDTHLILTAPTRCEDLAAAAGRFAAFGPAKLLFTHLDETSSYASVFCEAARERRPLSFLGNGQSIPEDLKPADKNLIAESLVRQLPERLRAVA
jgi:flagellar biosynthesis protein FlhF